MDTGTWFDIAVLVVVALSVLTGLMRGFFKELVALVAWVLAFWVGVNYTQHFSAYVSPYISDKTVCLGVTFALIIVACILLGAIVNAILGFILKHSGLGGADRVLGMGFGFIRGIIIVCLGLVILKVLGVNLNTYQADSQLYSYLNPVVNKMQQYIQPYLEEAKTKAKKEKI